MQARDVHAALRPAHLEAARLLAEGEQHDVIEHDAAGDAGPGEGGGAAQADALFDEALDASDYRFKVETKVDGAGKERSYTIVGEGANTVAEVIVEPIMSGAGIMVPPDEYLPMVEAICRKYDVLGYQSNGGYAEQVAVPISSLIPIPDRIDFVTAAAFPLTFLTAWHMLVTLAGVIAPLAMKSRVVKRVISRSPWASGIGVACARRTCTARSTQPGSRCSG